MDRIRFPIDGDMIGASDKSQESGQKLTYYAPTGEWLNHHDKELRKRAVEVQKKIQREDAARATWNELTSLPDKP